MTETPAADLLAALRVLTPDALRAFCVETENIVGKAGAPVAVLLRLFPRQTKRLHLQDGVSGAQSHADQMATLIAQLAQDRTPDDPTVFWDALRAEQARQLAHARALQEGPPAHAPA